MRRCSALRAGSALPLRAARALSFCAWVHFFRAIYGSCPIGCWETRACENESSGLYALPVCGSLSAQRVAGSVNTGAQAVALGPYVLKLVGADETQRPGGESDVVRMATVCHRCLSILGAALLGQGL